MAWKSFSFVENQGEITGKSFRSQTEQAINDIARYAESAIEIGLGDAITVAVDKAAEKATEEVKTVAVLTTPQVLDLEKQNQARLNINVASLDSVVLRKGNRGFLAGKSSTKVESVLGERAVTDDDSDTILLKSSGAITLNFTAADETTTAEKTIMLKAEAQSSLNVTGASWATGSAPEWGNVGESLLLKAHFIFGLVILSVLYKGGK